MCINDVSMVYDWYINILTRIIHVFSWYLDDLSMITYTYIYIYIAASFALYIHILTISPLLLKPSWLLNGGSQLWAPANMHDDGQCYQALIAKPPRGQHYKKK